MEVKKQIFIVLLLFANLLLLVHGVLPHIHHDGIICMAGQKVEHVASAKGCAEESACCGKHAEKQDSNGHHGEVEDCDLLSLLQRNERASVNSASDALATFSLFHITLLEHFGCFCFNSYLLDTERVETPYINNYTELFLGSIPSLRAPPVFFLG